MAVDTELASSSAKPKNMSPARMLARLNGGGSEKDDVDDDIMESWMRF